MSDFEDFIEQVETKLGPEAGAVCRAVQFTAAEMVIKPNAAPASATSSYVGGYPYVPASASDWTWPIGESSGEPMTFLCQVNFSEIEGLDGYPTSGLLQWFIDGADDTFGLTWESGSTRREGLTVRWYGADDLGPALHESGDELPYDEAQDGDPFEVVKGKKNYGPHAISFTTGSYLPHPNEAYENGSESDAMGAYSQLTEDLEDVSTDPPFAEGFAVGGRPVLVQGDPRPEDRDEDDCLLINLDSADSLFMWGDVGTAQLFGNPAKLATGDTSSLYWDWACY